MRIPSPCIVLCSAFAFKVQGIIIILFGGEGKQSNKQPPAGRDSVTLHPKAAARVPHPGWDAGPRREGRVSPGRECRGGAARPARGRWALNEFTSQLGREAAFWGAEIYSPVSQPSLPLR